jgi:hypothetical protein
LVKKASGELADLSFFKEVESCAASKEIRETFRILLYTRYRDDIFIVYDDDARWLVYITEVRRRASIAWILNEEDKSKTSLNYLDINVYKDDDIKTKKLLHFRPFVKKNGAKSSFK